jgi:hypothetical protein
MNTFINFKAQQHHLLSESRSLRNFRHLIRHHLFSALFKVSSLNPILHLLEGSGLLGENCQSLLSMCARECFFESLLPYQLFSRTNYAEINKAKTVFYTGEYSILSLFSM